MPVKKSAMKALRQGDKRAQRNKNVKADIKTILKKSRKAIDTKTKDAESLVKDTIKKFDKAAQKGIIKKNTAARKKSRLMKKLNKTADKKSK
jgi:small subunit ribosomal protein S20